VGIRAPVVTEPRVNVDVDVGVVGDVNVDLDRDGDLNVAVDYAHVCA
jgi:hypothetical protein